MAKKELLLGAVAAGLLFSGASAPAFAAKGEGKHHPRHAAMIERLDTDKDGKVSLDEFKTNAAATFKTFDADGDGQVTNAEIKARHDAFKDARKAVRNASDADKDKAREAFSAAGPFMLPGAGKMFDRADTDKSGKLSEAEVLAAAEKIFERRDSNRDGALDTADARPMKGKEHSGKKHHGKGGDERAERMLKRIDTNGDGKVSQEEMLAQASAIFQRFDADKNGEVSKAELDARRDAFRDARKAFREVKSTDDEARKAAREALGEARMDRMGARMFERADADKNGTLTKAEMETAAAAMFKQRDRNGDGFLTSDEIGKRHNR
ncbi:EF-hand domain-containing protein [Shinella sp. CPCC 101442]|uniref:EF-hand domain-containing protein n=1 Tax=Shinella sp. CPCC 101442 TaxID=2932265 RepID=UPI002152FAA6|nr:EF-hand domain-containing protein [Shinella sp. CPCC 101442]MCR6500787.1 EF-hand domain-containing protein [Shinella sp. CPCC 101442]